MIKAPPLAIPAAFALAFAGGGGFLQAETTADGGLTERAARVFSPEMRRTERRIAEVARELDGLPELLRQPFASRYGFRSETLFEKDEPHWVQIDLGHSHAIDRIAAVPAHIPNLGAHGEGYGFPSRFRIEVAEDPEMAGAVTVVDRTGEDVRNPGRFPLIFRVPPVEGRYVRFTSTRHFPFEAGFIWALEELLLLSGNQRVGVREPAAASSSLELFPNWSVFRVNDGQSALGVPATTERSPTRGYLSAKTNNPQEEKWLSVDLGRERVIDEIRLVPVESEGFESLGERSHPREWAVELATDAGFGEVVWRHHMPSTNLVGYPGRCAVSIGCPGRRGRHLRLVAMELWGTKDQRGFGLAELQVYSGGENVALGMPVQAKDSAVTQDGSGWAPEFAVDGFSSRRRLIEWPDFLDLIERRAGLEKERDDLLALRASKVRTTDKVFTYAGGALGTMALLGWGWLFVRQRTIRHRAVANLRDQIARDLHDDIGSNLGGIVLLSEMGSRHSADIQVREDFAAIKEAAEQTTESMQDIVWLIGRGNTGLRDLVVRMRHSAALLLGEARVSLTVDPPELRDRRLSLLFRRHVFFAFKETLNNIRRHAGATAVEVRIRIDGRHLAFEVKDDGVGFDPRHGTESGHGLTNLRRRAERLGGSCQVDSRPGQGTRVTFDAPMNS